VAKNTGRGSGKLRGISPAAVKKLTAATKGMKVIGWEELGQPGPEWINGTFTGRISRVGTTLNQLLRLNELRELRVLLRGTPRPDLAEINVSLRNG